MNLPRPDERVRVPGFAKILGVVCLGLLLLPTAAHADEPTTDSNDPVAAGLHQEIHQARAEMDLTLSRMQTTSRAVRDMLRDARRRGTSRQITCVDEALSRVDVAHRGARAHADEVYAAYSRSDMTSARLARVWIVELALVQKVAARDGNACFPQPTQPQQQAKIAEGTVVRLTIDPKIPRER